ncbi:hypothetical protein RvY_04738 [Ramazzottius varieornatus]|uniref:PRELI/MSF1 domain-containing protein n=1 Tax=Ramazzottius varieornatus TaxID=947166 RepID=A0A1D1USN7_RAMVA|nr:hypothetical protein RvY_04738 [Ramazzottius varieornatus]
MTIGWFFRKDGSPEPQSGRLHRSTAVFQYTWEQVVTGFWLRYPNPFSTHVLSEDVIQRYVSEDGLLLTKKLLTKTSRVPKWGERFVQGPTNVFVLEESIVDPQTKTLITYTRNLGFTKIMTVDEKCWYRPYPEDASLTELTRIACIESHVFGFAKAIQTFGIERYKRNTAKTEEGLLHTLARLYLSSSNPSDERTPGGVVNRMASLAGRAETIRGTARKATDVARLKTSDFLHASKTPTSHPSS